MWQSPAASGGIVVTKKDRAKGRKKEQQTKEPSRWEYRGIIMEMCVEGPGGGRVNELPSWLNSG